MNEEWSIFYHKNVCATLDVTDSGHVTRIPLSSVSGKFLLILRTVIAVPLQVDGLFLRLKTKLISEKHIWGRSNFQPWSFAAKMDTTSEKQEGISCISWFKARQKSRRVARVASKLRMEVVQHSGLMWRRTSFDLKLRFCNFANHWPMGKFSLQWLTWPSFHIQQRSEVWTEGQRYEQKVRGMNRRSEEWTEGQRYEQKVRGMNRRSEVWTEEYKTVWHCRAQSGLDKMQGTTHLTLIADDGPCEDSQTDQAIIN